MKTKNFRFYTNQLIIALLAWGYFGGATANSQASKNYEDLVKLFKDWRDKPAPT